MKPYYIEIPYLDISAICSLFASDTTVAWLDSANQAHPSALNRYSYLGVDPVSTLICGDGAIDPLSQLKQWLAPYQCDTIPELPPFQGGAMGFLSYDLCHSLDNIPLPQDAQSRFPLLAFALYDLIISIDHHIKRAWIVCCAINGDAEQRVTALQQKINRATTADTHFAANHAEIVSNFSAQGYQAMVQQVMDYIRAGDIFEANVTQCFTTTLPENASLLALYLKLRAKNPAPFAAFIKFQDTVLASASPERFLQCHQGQVETRPIKGTRPRGKTATEDQQLATELSQSEKDRAENIMIVDLMRNDLSKVCEDDSIIVPQLCGLESFATVHHLVSVVEGKLKKNSSAIDLLRATFPGGSITGAPKIRTMEIISELETVRRGPYCGSIGYIGFNGNMDLSITIRTFAIHGQHCQFQAGGAVVLDSDPHEEYLESLAKAKALRETLSP